MTHYTLTVALGVALCLLPACVSTSQIGGVESDKAESKVMEQAKAGSIEIMAPEAAKPEMEVSMAKTKDMAADLAALATPDLMQESLFYNAQTQWEL